MTKKKSKSGIDFEKELTGGHKTYNKKVGKWWLKLSSDKKHARAYRAIANHLKENVPGDPRLIIDYACGSGRLLARLVRRFPKAKVIGIDGSRLMLDAAEERVEELGKRAAGRVELIESPLPNFELDCKDADLVVFCFANICPEADEQDYYDEHGATRRADVTTARRLARARESNPDWETVTSSTEDLYNAMMDGKVVSRNLRALLRKGGYCARVEYANAKRKELTELVRMRMDFEAGALGKPFEGKKAEQIFRLRKSTYIGSRVIEAVYHHTGDDADRVGGFLVNLLRAI